MVLFLERFEIIIFFSFNENEKNKQNLKFFIQNGIIQNPNYLFVFIINSYNFNSKIEDLINNYDNTIIFRKNIFLKNLEFYFTIFKRMNLINNQSQLLLSNKSIIYIFINSELMGPFNCTFSQQNWIENLKSKILSNNYIQLITSNIEINNNSIPSINLNFLVLKNSSLQLLLNQNIFNLKTDKIEKEVDINNKILNLILNDNNTSSVILSLKQNILFNYTNYQQLAKYLDYNNSKIICNQQLFINFIDNNNNLIYSNNQIKSFIKYFNLDELIHNDLFEIILSNCKGKNKNDNQNVSNYQPLIEYENNSKIITNILINEIKILEINMLELIEYNLKIKNGYNIQKENNIVLINNFNNLVRNRKSDIINNKILTSELKLLEKQYYLSSNPKNNKFSNQIKILERYDKNYLNLIIDKDKYLEFLKYSGTI